MTPDLIRVPEAVKIAAAAVARRTLTERELRDRLVDKGVKEPVLSAALDRCRTLRLVDDDSYARSFARSRAGRGHGPDRIRHDLMRRGIPRDLVDEALVALNEEPEAVPRPAEVLRRRFATADLSEPKSKARALRFLAGRGFRSDEAYSAIRELSGDVVSVD